MIRSQSFELGGGGDGDTGGGTHRRVRGTAAGARPGRAGAGARAGAGRRRPLVFGEILTNDIFVMFHFERNATPLEGLHSANCAFNEY